MDRDPALVQAAEPGPAAAEAERAEPAPADDSHAPVMLTDAVCGQVVAVRGDPRLV